MYPHVGHETTGLPGVGRNMPLAATEWIWWTDLTWVIATTRLLCGFEHTGHTFPAKTGRIGTTADLTAVIGSYFR